MNLKTLNGIRLFIRSFRRIRTNSYEPIVIGQNFYTYASSPGDVKILKVAIVDETRLTAIFGTTWSNILQAAFGSGCNVIGARSKSVVTTVDRILTQDYGLSAIEVANITINYWLWIIEVLNNLESDFNELPLYFLKHPKNLTALVNFYTYFYLGTTYDVTVPFSLGFLGKLPTHASSFLSELDWEDDWTPSGFTITHESTTDYIIYGFVWGFGFYPIGSMLQDCTEIWTLWLYLWSFHRIWTKRWWRYNRL